MHHSVDMVNHRKKYKKVL